MSTREDINDLCEEIRQVVNKQPMSVVGPALTVILAAFIAEKRGDRTIETMAAAENALNDAIDTFLGESSRLQ